MTDYDEIHDAYRETKANPVKRYSEAYTFLEALGDVTGRAVLDVACGDGYYTRQLADRGAARVVGVDLSARMIDDARAAERACGRSPAIEYRVGDATALEALGRFDVVTAVYLFTYADSEARLAAMCRGLAANLRPGGRLVAVTFNPDATPWHLTLSARYGATLDARGPLVDGAVIDVCIDTRAGPVRLVNHHWTRPTYTRALTAAGFADVQWPATRVSPAGVVRFGAAYWQPHLEAPGPVVVTATRA